MNQILKQLLPFLSYKDLKNCRLVCSSWKELTNPLFTSSSQLNIEMAWEGDVEEITSMDTLLFSRLSCWYEDTRMMKLLQTHGSLIKSILIWDKIEEEEKDEVYSSSDQSFSFFMNKLLGEWCLHLEEIELLHYSYSKGFQLGLNKPLPNIQSLSILSNMIQKNPGLCELLVLCNQIQTLKLRGGIADGSTRILSTFPFQYLRSIRLEDMTLSDVTRALSSLPTNQLEEASLTEIRVSPDPHLQDSISLDIFPRLQNLQKLILQFYNDGMMEQLELDFENLFPYNNNLKSLEINVEKGSIRFTHGMDFISWLPTLKSLRIQEICNNEKHSLFADGGFWVHAPRLKSNPHQMLQTLEISSENLLAHMLDSLPESFPSLTSVKLETGDGCQCMRSRSNFIDELLRTFKRSPKLKQLSIYSSFSHSSNCHFGRSVIPSLEILMISSGVNGEEEYDSSQLPTPSLPHHSWIVQSVRQGFYLFILEGFKSE